MSILQSVVVGSGSGSGGARLSAREIPVSSTAIGKLYSLPRLLGRTSQLSLVAGGDANLTLAGTDLVAKDPIGFDDVQTVIVREVDGDLLCQYPITLRGKPGVPTLTLTGPATITPKSGEDTASATFTLRVKRNGFAGDLAYRYGISGGTAVDADFLPPVLPSGSGIIPAGQDAATFTVAVSSAEAERTFELTARLTGAGSVSNSLTTVIEAVAPPSTMTVIEETFAYPDNTSLIVPAPNGPGFIWNSTPFAQAKQGNAIITRSDGMYLAAQAGRVGDGQYAVYKDLGADNHGVAFVMARADGDTINRNSYSRSLRLVYTDDANYVDVTLGARSGNPGWTPKISKCVNGTVTDLYAPTYPPAGTSIEEGVTWLWFVQAGRVYGFCGTQRIGERTGYDVSDVPPSGRIGFVNGGALDANINGGGARPLYRKLTYFTFGETGTNPGGTGGPGGSGDTGGGTGGGTGTPSNPGGGTTTPTDPGTGGGTTTPTDPGTGGGTTTPPVAAGKAIAGMNMPFIEYWDHVDVAYDLAHRCTWRDLKSWYLNRLDEPLVFNVPGAPGATSIVGKWNASADGQPISGTAPNGSAITVGTIKRDALGTIYKENSIGANLSRASTYLLGLPYWIEPARTHSFIIDFQNNAVVSRWRGGVTGTLLSPGKYLIQFPTDYNVGNGVEVNMDNVSAVGVNLRIYPAVSDGAGGYLPYDATKVLTDEEDVRLNQVCSYLRNLNILGINNDAVRGDTDTTFALREAGFEKEFSAQEVVAMSNQTKLGLWFQLSHRDSDARIAEVARTLTGISTVLSFLELSNETWNTKFTQGLEIKLMGCRDGYADASKTRSEDCTPMTIGNNGIGNATASSSPRSAGERMFMGVNGFGWVVIQATRDLPTGTPTPRKYSETTNYKAGDTTWGAGEQVFVALQDNVGSAPDKSPGYWAVATGANSPWIKVFGNSDTFRAGVRWLATRSKRAWAITDQEFAAVGKTPPKHVVNIQTTSSLTSTISTMLAWDGFDQVVEYVSVAPYIGGVYGADTANFQKSITGWTNADRLALYDTDIDPDAAVSRALDRYLSPATRSASIDAAINGMVSLQNALDGYYSGKGSDRRPQVITYEQAWVGTFAGFPEQTKPLAAWKTDTAYAQGTLVPSDNPASPYQAVQPSKGVNPTTDDGTHWVLAPQSYAQDSFLWGGNPAQLYRAVQASTGVNPLTDDGTNWKPITLPASGLTRIGELFVRLQRDRRFGEWSREYDIKFANALPGHYNTKFDSQGDMPTAPSSINWGHRETSDGVDAPAWQACIETHADWSALAEAA